MADVERLRKMVKDFAFWSRPSNTNQQAACTVGDLNRMVDRLKKVLDAIIDVMEESPE